MPLVVEREIAVARRSVRRQIEQEQPADAGREHQTGITQNGGGVLRSGRERLAQPRRGEEQRDRRPQQPEHEVGGHRQRVRRFATQRMSRCEWPWHPPEPCCSGPCRKRERDAERRRPAAAAQIEQQQPRERPRRPLPARRSKQSPHRLVLGDLHGCRARVGHQRRRGGERIGRLEPVAAIA